MSVSVCICIFFFFKQKTAYEMRISDWSSDVCSSDLLARGESGGDVRDFDLHPLRSAKAAVPAVPGDRRDGDQGHRAQEARRELGAGQIGRASCRERVCQYV